MAQRVSLKWFYWGIGALAVAGGGWIWASVNRSSAASFAQPLPPSEVAAAAGFPGYVLGSDSAPVEITEYADFQCPACAQFWVLTFHDIEARLIGAGKVRWRFHDRPLDGPHVFARLAAHSGACAGEQGRFWPMQDQLFGNQATWSVQRNPDRSFRAYARAIGLDLTRYDDCMRTGRYRARIQADVEAAEQLGVTSTPTFVIGRMRYPRAMVYDDFKRLIDSSSTKPAPRSR